MLRWCIAALLCARRIRSLSGTGPVDPESDRDIAGVTSRNLSRVLRLRRGPGPGPGRPKALATSILVLGGILHASGPRAGFIDPGPDGTR